MSTHDEFSQAEPFDTLDVLGEYNRMLPAVSPGETPPLVPDDRDIKEADDLADKVVDCLWRENAAILDGATYVYHAYVRFAEGSVASKHFQARLESRGVWPKGDSRLGGKSQQSKLREIGKNSDFLRITGIADRLPSGLTVLYQAVKLRDALPGNENEQTAKVIALITEGVKQGELSRAYLERLTSAAKRKSKKHNRNADTSGPQQLQGLNFDLLLLTPTDRDIKRIEADGSDELALPLCLRLKEIAADNAVVVSIAPVSALPTLTKRIFDDGFRTTHILLLEQPEHADITDVRVLVITERGSGTTVQVPLSPWPWAGCGNYQDLARTIAPQATIFARLFANEKSDGWTSYIEAANWSKVGAS